MGAAGGRCEGDKGYSCMGEVAAMAEVGKEAGVMGGDWGDCARWWRLGEGKKGEDYDLG